VVASTRACRHALVDARRASVARFERWFAVAEVKTLLGMCCGCSGVVGTRPSDDGCVDVGSAGVDAWMEDVNRAGHVSRWVTCWATFGLAASVPRLRCRGVGRGSGVRECGGESLGGFVGYSERGCAECESRFDTSVRAVVNEVAENGCLEVREGDDAGL